MTEGCIHSGCSLLFFVRSYLFMFVHKYSHLFINLLICSLFYRFVHTYSDLFTQKQYNSCTGIVIHYKNIYSVEEKNLFHTYLSKVVRHDNLLSFLIIIYSSGRSHTRFFIGVSVRSYLTRYTNILLKTAKHKCMHPLLIFRRGVK